MAMAGASPRTLTLVWVMASVIWPFTVFRESAMLCSLLGWDGERVRAPAMPNAALRAAGRGARFHRMIGAGMDGSGHDLPRDGRIRPGRRKSDIRRQDAKAHGCALVHLGGLASWRWMSGPSSRRPIARRGARIHSCNWRSMTLRWTPSRRAAALLLPAD